MAATACLSDTLQLPLLPLWSPIPHLDLSLASCLHPCSQCLSLNILCAATRMTSLKANSGGLFRLKTCTSTQLSDGMLSKLLYWGTRNNGLLPTHLHSLKHRFHTVLLSSYIDVSTLHKKITNLCFCIFALQLPLSGIPICPLLVTAYIY